MKKVLMFCHGYGEMKSCLYLAKSYSQQNNDVTIAVLNNPDLLKFLTEVNDSVFHHSLSIINIGFSPVKKPEQRGLSRLLYYLLDIIREQRYNRKICEKYFASLNGAEIYFFSRCYSALHYYFLNKLQPRNKLVYMCVLDFEDSIRKYAPRNIRDLIWLVRRKFVYGFGVAAAELPHAVFDYIPDKFFIKKVDRFIQFKEAQEILRDFSLDEFKIFDSGAYSVLYFDQPLIDAGHIADRSTFKKELNEVFTVLKKYFPSDEIAIKYHPAYWSERVVINAGVVVDDYIPAEFLYNDKVKIYLGYSSTSLTNLEKGLAVSIIDLITYRDKKAKKFIKENTIKRSHTDILFPKSLDEFEKIVAGVTG